MSLITRGLGAGGGGGTVINYVGEGATLLLDTQSYTVDVTAPTGEVEMTSGTYALEVTVVSNMLELQDNQGLELG